MRRRKRNHGLLIAAVLSVLVLVTVAVVLILWRGGGFVPSWAQFRDSVNATDENAQGIAESVVLKEKTLVIYSGGNEVYRSDAGWQVQDVVWQDFNGDGFREIAALYWREGAAGEASDRLTTADASGLTQHIAVFGQITDGMQPVWDSAALAVEAASFRADDNGRIVITEAEGGQSLWVFNGAKVVSVSSPEASYMVQTAEPAGTTPGQQESPVPGTPAEGTGQQPAGDAPENGDAAQQTTEAAQSTSSSVTFLAVGDDLPHPMVFRYGVNQTGGNYDYLFTNVSNVLQSVDFAVLNQETVFVKNETEYSGYPTFGSPLGIGEAAIRNGFNVFLCATNHTMDKGLYGLETTAEFFNSHSGQVTYLGTYLRDDWQNPEHDIRVVSKNGISFALLNYTYGLNGIPIPADAPYSVDTYYYDENWYDANLIAANEQKMRSDIRRAKELADVVIFFPHWGTEYRYTPDPYQEKWTNILLEEGVDVVVGTHPHVVEPVEMLVRGDGHEMLVYYSLGNFVSGQNEAPRVLGGMAKFTVTKKDGECRVSAYDMLPIITHQEIGNGPVAAYMYSDYTNELAARHVLGINKDALGTLFRNVVDWKAY
ncbi:MAG: CapA family protein [Lachnospiraceae bacterium]|nr:CapA family protein [Lachnospiraceae bacterium]